MKIPPLLLLTGIVILWRAPVLAQTPVNSALQDQVAQTEQAKQQLDSKVGTFAQTHANDSPVARQKALAELANEQQRLAEAARVQVQGRAVQEVPIVQQVDIPADATPAQEELVVSQAQMRNEQVRLSQALRGANGLQRSAALQAWQEKNRALIAALHGQAAMVAAESAKTPLAAPLVPQIAPGTSPESQAFILQRYIEIKQRIEAENHRRAALPE